MYVHLLLRELNDADVGVYALDEAGESTSIGMIYAGPSGYSFVADTSWKNLYSHDMLRSIVYIMDDIDLYLERGITKFTIKKQHQLKGF